MLTLFVIPAFILSFPLQGSFAFDLPDEAFRLIAEADADPCSICAEQKLKEAFALMAAGLRPGLILETDSTCRMVKRSPQDEPELSLTCYPSAKLAGSVGGDRKPPDLSFAFYTSKRHLVGVSEQDYTDDEVAERFRTSPPGTVFEGKMRLIPYRYGDGPAFNYFPAAGKVRVHCVVLELRPAAQQGPGAGPLSPPPRFP